MDDEAVLGKNNYVGPFCYIGPGVTIGNNNLIQGHASIGTPAEHRDYFTESGPIRIGNHNIIREFVTINSPTTKVTQMGNQCVLLRGSHLSHDSILEDYVNLSCNVLIGGDSYVMEFANLGLGAIIHQRQVIGSYCMIGAGAIVTKGLDCLPGKVYVGNPARYLKVNSIGLQRNNVDEHVINMERRRYDSIRNSLRPVAKA